MGAITKNKYLQELQSAQRLINIKIAKAYRTTISFEASCVIAGVPPIGLVIDGKVQFYKREHGLENSDIICDMPLPVHKWPHPARQVTVMETNEASKYRIERYMDGSKAAGQESPFTGTSSLQCNVDISCAVTVLTARRSRRLS